MEKKLGQQPSGIVKVVLFGPESTGKTTLAQKLAAHYNAPWVPEYAREYLQEKWDKTWEVCQPEDLLPIAEGQMRLENERASQADRLLICDTDILETLVYSETYYGGFSDPELKKYALQNEYDLYFLTYIDVPWVKDDLRDRPGQRQEMFEAFRKALEENNRRFVILQGGEGQRFQLAVQYIDKLLSMSTFNEKDLEYLQQKGISPEKVREQIGIFEKGIPFVNLKKAAVIDDGIVRLDKAEQQRFEQAYQEAGDSLKVLKFTPASGAASRMFKALFAFLQEFKPDSESLEAYLERSGNQAVRAFYEQLERFPFYEIVSSRIGLDPGQGGAFLHAFVSEMLTEKGLNFGFYPKGLLPFHQYDEHLATPLEEHLREGAAYAQSGGSSSLHFTISPQHEELFEQTFSNIREGLTRETACEFSMSHSFQRPSTDTLAVDPENRPFRDSSGQMLFRPGGHGALLENLNEQDADLLFIKNIDNVVVKSQLGVITKWKKILAGYLIEVQQQAFRYTRMLDEGKLDHDLLHRIHRFLEDRLNARFPDSVAGLSLEDQVEVLKDKLKRPIRVCGMVKNEGEPGGGPFWIVDQDGHQSLQIVESAQVDLENEGQYEIFQASTHFNPVDLVCGVCDAYGVKYNLMNFVDPRQGFITDKTYEGRPLKALELPGLWNGGMAYWNTIFVEVPVSTFNPVKTVNDLLKPAHMENSED